MRKYLNTLLIILIMMGGMYNFYVLSRLISPVTKNARLDAGRDFLRESLEYLRCPRYKILQVKSGIESASNSTGISQLLLASLLYTESGFRYGPISNKGYIGIAQTPYASIKYPEVDIMHGAMILKDKLRYAKGNIFVALTLYKGGRNPVARKQARQVIQVYNSLIEKIG